MDSPIYGIIELSRRPESSAFKTEPKFQIKEIISDKPNKFNPRNKRRDKGARKRVLKDDKRNKKYITTGARSSMGLI